MSALAGQVEVVGVNDALSNYNDILKPLSTVMIANDKFNPRVFPSTSLSNDTVAFSNVSVPDNKTFVDKLMLLRVTYTITFTGKTVAVGQRLLQTGFDALRAMPINSCINVAGLLINGASFPSQPFMYVKELLRFNRASKDLNIDFSGSAAMLDNTQEYADTANTIRNPLAKWADNPYIVPRGGAVEFTNVINPATVLIGDLLTASITFTVTEPLVLSPCIFSTWKRTGFYGIDSMTLNLTFGELEKRIWSHNPANTTQFSVNLVNINAADLQLMYASPQTSEKKRYEGLGFVYPYYRPTPQITSSAAVASNNSTNVTTAVTTFPSIPHSVFVWVRERRSDIAVTKADAYFRIDRLSITFGNSATQFAQATPYQLYVVAVRNGYSGTYQDWYGAIRYECVGGTESKVTGIGSIACFKFGSDIPLGPEEAPGLAGQYTFQATLDMTNVNQTRTITPEIVVMPVYEGAMSVTPSGTSTTIAMVTLSDIRHAHSPQAGRVCPACVAPSVGGSKVGDWFEDAGNWLLENVLPGVIGAAIPIGIRMAMGGSNSNVGGAIVVGGGVGMAGSKGRDNYLKGGAKLGKEEFMSALKK
jgi:hypothetical protein